MVEEIEHLGAELKFQVFTNHEILENREIDIGATGSAQDVAGSVAEGEDGRGTPGGTTGRGAEAGVKPFCD